MGGAYYHAGTPGSSTYYGTIDYLKVDEYDGGATHVGFRVVRDLTDYPPSR